MIFSDIPVQYIGWRGGVRLMLGSRGDRSACESAHATGAEERRNGRDGFGAEFARIGLCPKP